MAVCSFTTTHLRKEDLQMKKSLPIKKLGKKHVVCRGNRRIIRASREAIGAMKYKGQ